jgi:hypothetical protein
VLELHDMAAVEEVAASLPAVGGRSHLPQYHGRLNYLYTSPFHFSRSLFSSRSSPRFILGPRQLSRFPSKFLSSVLVNISSRFFFRMFFSSVFYYNQRICKGPTSTFKQRLDFCTAKISVEHGMGGFRRFLQRVFLLGFINREREKAKFLMA